jgi:hypothetical protein
MGLTFSYRATIRRIRYEVPMAENVVPQLALFAALS